MVRARLGRHSRQLKQLRRRLRQRTPGEVVVEGNKLLRDLSQWGVELSELYIGEGLLGAPVADELARSAREVYLVADQVLQELAPSRHPQGLLAIVAEPVASEPPLERGVTLLLDGVQDPGNLGALVRAAAALGAEGVLLSGACCDPFHPAAVRGSAGAAFVLPVVRAVDVDAAIGRVRAAAGEVWAADGAGMPIADWQPSEPLLLVLGGEGAGVDRALLEAADGRVAIPLERRIESLNVVVAAGILLQTVRGLLQGPG
jgi:TrmH family RNA methyltransferase